MILRLSWLLVVYPIRLYVRWCPGTACFFEVALCVGRCSSPLVCPVVSRYRLLLRGCLVCWPFSSPLVLAFLSACGEQAHSQLVSCFRCWGWGGVWLSALLG